MTIETIDRLSVKVGGKEIPLNKRKSRAVIGYLALSDHPTEARNRLVGLLWSEASEDNARGSLRTTLHEVRAAFHAAGYDGLITDKLQISLRPQGLDIDVRNILDDAKKGIPHQLLLERERIFDRIMADCEDLDPAFHSWLLPKRQALQERVLRDLSTAMRGATGASAEKLTRAILNLEPSHEEAARTLIALRYQANDIGDALGIYKRLWDYLEEEYEAEPLPATQELIAKIKLSQPLEAQTGRTAIALPGDGAPVPRAPPGSATKLIVSLGSFDSEGVPPESRFLVQEFRRELIANLVRFREWIVRDQPPDNGAAGKSGDQDVVLDGGAYQTDTGVRLVLTLREPVSRAYLWSEKLDISRNGWWTSQQSIVQRMASALNVHISADRLATISRRPVSNLTAHDIWLRGQATMRSFDEADWHKAAELFRELILRWPTFAPAYSSLAQLQNSIHVSHYGVFRDQRRRDEALSSARESVRLDPSDSRALLSLGWSHLMAEQFDQAMGHFELAIELNENDPWTMISSALGCAFSGEHDHALAQVERARALSPSPGGAHWGYETRIHALAGRFEKAAELMDRAAPVPALPPWRALILAQVGMQREARLELQRFYELSRMKWSATAPWSEEAAMRWFLHAFPIRSPGDWERLRKGLLSIGAPVETLRHRFWDNPPGNY